jgi:hypothetical protein
MNVLDLLDLRAICQHQICNEQQRSSVVMVSYRLVYCIMLILTPFVDYDSYGRLSERVHKYSSRVDG